MFSMRKKITLKNTHNELKLFHQRTLLLSIGILLLVAILITRLMYLQIWQHNLYTTLSTQNKLNVTPIEPKRGLIYDRDGILLAENVPVYSLDVIPDKVKHLKQTVAKLKKFIPIDDQDVRDFYKLAKQKHRFEPVPLKLKLTEAEVARFAVNQWRFPGVTVNARLMRYYPMDKDLAHVIGFMSRINVHELNQVNATNYSATNYIGKVGIEKYFEHALHGQVGSQQVETDASGRVIRVLKRTSPTAGADIYLTIDSKLERVAEQALGGDDGAVVVIQPNTGQVLALVSSPSYNPNLFVQGISHHDFKALRDSSQQPLYNRAIRGLYSPGSTIKPFISLEGLYSETVTPDYSIYDRGYFIYGNHTYKDWLRGGHGWVKLHRAIVVSCDTYFYNLGVMLGIKKIDHILNQFGFGHNTHIEMHEELPGLVPTPTWKLKTKGHGWYTGDTIITAIGQGSLLATPLQLAIATATISEHGKRLQPHLLLKMQMPNGDFIYQQPTLLPPLMLPNSDWQEIQSAMRDVIESNQGTGFRFGRNAPYSVAAKTGTAQVFSSYKHYHVDQQALPKRLRDNSLFIAYAPIKDPQIAIAVVTEHDEAAPRVARKVMDYYLLTEHHLQK